MTSHIKVICCMQPTRFPRQSKQVQRLPSQKCHCANKWFFITRWFYLDKKEVESELSRVTGGEGSLQSIRKIITHTQRYLRNHLEPLLWLLGEDPTPTSQQGHVVAIHRAHNWQAPAVCIRVGGQLTNKVLSGHLFPCSFWCSVPPLLTAVHFQS